MKNYFFAITSIIILLLTFSGCAEPDSSYLVVAEYEIDGGSQTATVLVFEGLTTPVMDAEVRVNGYLLDMFFFGVYMDLFDSIPDLSAGDTVNVSVKVGGSEIMNESAVIPVAPVITSPSAGAVNSTLALPVIWTGTPPVDEYMVSVEYPDTVSLDGYSAYVSGSTSNHTIPANIMVPGNAFTEIYVSAANITMASGDFLSSASQLNAVNTDVVTVNTN